VQDRNTRLNEAPVHRLEILDLESNVRACCVILRAPRKDRKMKVRALVPRVLVVAAADPWITWPAIVARFKGNTDKVSIELGGPLQISRPEND
jgi:hypothetical protein